MRTAEFVPILFVAQTASASRQPPPAHLSCRGPGTICGRMGQRTGIVARAQILVFDRRSLGFLGLPFSVRAAYLPSSCEMMLLIEYAFLPAAVIICNTVVSWMSTCGAE